jgi:hypothetical protein
MLRENPKFKFHVLIQLNISAYKSNKMISSIQSLKSNRAVHLLIPPTYYLQGVFAVLGQVE